MLYRTPKGYPIWNGMAVDGRDLPSLRESLKWARRLADHDPEIKREADHTEEVIRALEDSNVHA